MAAKSFEDSSTEEKVEMLFDKIAKLEGSLNSFAIVRESATTEIGNLRSEIDKSNARCSP